MVKLKTKLYKPKQLRDFDKNPMKVKIEGHTLTIYNNIVEHNKECEKCGRA